MRLQTETHRSVSSRPAIYVAYGGPGLALGFLVLDEDGNEALDRVFCGDHVDAQAALGAGLGGDRPDACDQTPRGVLRAEAEAPDIEPHT